MTTTSASIAWPPTLQQRMMLDFISVTDDRYYVMTEVFRYDGVLSLTALRSAVSNVLDRHDVLRAVYDPGGRFVVRASGKELVDDVVVDDSAPEDGEAAVKAVRAALERPMDLTREAPIRVRTWRAVSGSEFVIGIATHHLAFDAWSQMLLYEELATGYESAMNGTSLAPGPAPQYRALDETSGADAMKAWAAMFQRPYAAVRAVSGRAVEKRGPGAALRYEWPALSAGVRRVAKAHGVTSFVVGASAFLLALSDALGDSEVIIGCALAGRTTPASAEALGYFSTSMFLSADTSEGDDAVLQRVAGAVHAWTTGPRIQWEPLLKLHCAEDLYPFKFAFQPEALADRQLHIAGARGTKVSVDSTVASARRPMDCIASYDASVVRASAIHRTDAIEDATARRLIEGFGGHLERLAAGID